MNILFICSRNEWRSRTAETIFKNHPVHSIRSAGTEPSARIKISEKLVHWADLIFVMEKRHRDRLNERFRTAMADKEIVVLAIPDEFGYMDEELIEILTTSLSPFLDR